MNAPTDARRLRASPRALQKREEFGLAERTPVAENGNPAGDFGANAWLVEELYKQYSADPNSVDRSWWPILQRFGSRRTMSAATVGFVTAMTLLAIGVGVSSLPLVCAGIFLNGMSFALNNVPFNVESAQIERAVGRTIIPQFHACFSIGALLGTLLGAAASWGGVSVPVQVGISAKPRYDT